MAKRIPSETLIDLRRRLNMLRPRCSDRRLIIKETADLYGISEKTLYRLLSERARPKSIRRTDFGKSRRILQTQMEQYCEVIAALKIRTSNKKGRQLSTAGAIRLLEDHGVQTPTGWVKVDKGTLKRTTVNRYLKQCGFDKESLNRVPPAVRFQAEHSNDCWQFDLSPSDLKSIEEPIWIKEQKGHPQLMLYSVVDDRSGAAYQEYRCVYGEDAESGLRFLFNAMATKNIEGFPLQGIPKMIYMDNGPIAKSMVFRRVMDNLGVDVQTHVPAGKDGHRPTARSKGKVERPFRTVKEMHETLYHFHKPKDETEANAWLIRFLLRYNGMQHRSESHSRMEDWLNNLPSNGIREMCSWDRFCTFAREPERRKVGVDARINVNGNVFEVSSDLAGESVILWWGLFDYELYVEWDEQRYGPYAPIGGPIPLHRYRTYKKSRRQQGVDRVDALAEQLAIPKAALEHNQTLNFVQKHEFTTVESFQDPDPFQEISYANSFAAKRAIAETLGFPLGKLPTEQLESINRIVDKTLDKKEIMTQIREYFKV